MTTDLPPALLRSYVTAVRLGSIGRAAGALGKTQPALSQQLRKLEGIVGRELLHRSPSGVLPTPAGQELLPYAQRILSLSAQALSETGRALTGRCGVGLLEDLVESDLALALADLARIHPEARLEVFCLPTAAMREAYETGRVQLVLDAVADLPAEPRWTIQRPLAWAVWDEVDVDADPLPVVLFSDPCPWRTAVVDALAQAGRSTRITFESNSLAGVLAAVRAGLGVTAVMPANLEPAMLHYDVGALPPLPEIELGLARHPRTDGDQLINAVETVLQRSI
ncbi:LysR family transcriptional regulator [Kribbella sp. NPDC056861]|uniref:LysR family transcriptional regulator n=1 Tax=Kribbella sp. NPDC056861 TaxID=3154857 RepID=UPI00343FE583